MNHPNIAHYADLIHQHGLESPQVHRYYEKHQHNQKFAQQARAFKTIYPTTHPQAVTEIPTNQQKDPAPTYRFELITGLIAILLIGLGILCAYLVLIDAT